MMIITPESPTTETCIKGIIDFIKENEVLVKRLAELKEENLKLRQSRIETPTDGNVTASENTSLLPNGEREQSLENAGGTQNGTIANLCKEHINSAILLFRSDKVRILRIIFLLAAYLLTFYLGARWFSSSTVTIRSCTTANNNCSAIITKINNECIISNIFEDFYNDCPLTADYLSDNSTCYPEIYQSYKNIFQEQIFLRKAKERVQTRYLIAHNWKDAGRVFGNSCDMIHHNYFNFSHSNVSIYNRNVFMPLIIGQLSTEFTIDHVYNTIYEFCKNIKLLRPDANVHILFLSTYGTFPFHIPQNNTYYSTFNQFAVENFSDFIKAIKTAWPLFARQLLHWLWA